MNSEIKELESAIPVILDRIKKEVRNVDMIIVHGSALDRSKFKPGISDLDILVIADARSYLDALPDLSDIKGEWKYIDLYIRPRSVLRHRNFELSFIARVLRGRVIFDSGLDMGIETPDRATAQREVVQNLMKFAFDRMRFASTDTYLNGDTSWLVARSACFALHSFLIEREVDIVHPDLRWNLPVLIELAATFEPSLGKLAPCAEIIPYRIASTDLDELPCIDETPELSRKARMEKAAAFHIMRAVKRFDGSGMHKGWKK